MSEHLPKDPVTLDNLKRAIAEYSLSLKLDSADESYAERLNASARDAWRTAFEWHVGLIQRHADRSEELSHLADWVAIDREEEEGMALIREKLQS